MNTPYKTFCQLFGMLKAWMPWRSEPVNLSRDFWMPDQSCRVCYECDSQFTILNRRHHCRICGRVFCARCTANSVPAPSGDPRRTLDEEEKVRVCNYCYKQWEQSLTTLENGIWVSKHGFSSSPSAISLGSTISSGTHRSSSITIGSVPYSIGKYQQVHCSSNLSLHQSPFMETAPDRQRKVAPVKSNDLFTDTVVDPGSNRYGISANRSDDDEDDYAEFQTPKPRDAPSVHDFYSQSSFDEMTNDIGSHKVHPDGEVIDTKSLSSSPLQKSFVSPCSEEIPQLGKKENEHEIGDEGEASSSLYATGEIEAEPVDFENNGLLWLPPEPEDEDDEKEPTFFDDDDGGATGEWGCLPMCSSFGSGESRYKERSNEEQKKAMKNVVDGHFRALVAQLLQVENLLLEPVDDKESWLEIITSLSWEAATLLKPDTSKSGGMDPGGYVKVKRLASGHRSESMVVKGVVCKKNVAHRRMSSKIEKPRLLILGGALEYQRITNHFSSFHTLLQQEMDHLKMAVAKIDAQKPDLLLVEKSVSRFAQDYVLEKGISLVLNIKRPLLERMARCTGAQIIPSIDHLSSQKLGYCETFHVERFAEDLDTAVQGGKKMSKTLMFFEGCPKPLGCTILLRGADRAELKKVKHVFQYGVFAAYHLAMETSFLADEGASLPDFQLDSSITVGVPDKSSSILRSISLVPGFSVSADGKFQGPNEPQRSLSVPISDFSSNLTNKQPCHNDLDSISKPPSNFINAAASYSSSPGKVGLEIYHKNLSLHTMGDRGDMGFIEPLVMETSAVNNSLHMIYNRMTAENLGSLKALGHDLLSISHNDLSAITANHLEASFLQDGKIHNEERGSLNEDPGLLKEEFPPSPSDHQSILVSLSSRCVWKGTVCERCHLFRIKYYGSFDKPLGRFLRDHLFDQSYRCQSCDMPSEAHIHCYTHRQGTVTISVKKLSEILLPGERDGKIWMWHRCLRCPRTDGFPPATRRIVMSDAAWGLSFGKFLELSFSNHAAASRVASCGHSLHRDCLRFYGFGKMVACFRYASIHVLSVYLPPSKLDFNCEKQEWLQKEIDEVIDRAELLFSEVLNALSQIEERRFGTRQQNSGMKTPETRRQIVDLEVMLQKEKTEFEESLHKTLNRESKQGQPLIDILEINRIRRQLLFQSYVWDHRLIYVDTSDHDSFQNHLSPSASKHDRKTALENENIAELNMAIKTGKGYNSCDSLILNFDHNKHLHCQTGYGTITDQSDSVPQVIDIHSDLVYGKKDRTHKSPEINTSNESSSFEVDVKIRRTLSDGQLLVMRSLSDTLDAAWTGKTHSGLVTMKGSPTANPDFATADSSNASTITDGLNLDHTEDQSGSKFHSLSPALSTKGTENMEDSVSWLTIPFLNFYRSLNKNFSTSAQKLGTLWEYNSIYVSTFRNAELQAGARLLLPVGVNDTVVPVYDKEPTSIISYALVSPEYQLQMNDEGERSSGDFVASSDWLSFQSVHLSDDTVSESFRSQGSGEESILSLSGPLGSMTQDPFSCTKAFHPRISFEDDGPLGKVKYSVTCYYGRRFEVLRRICCPSELDYVRSLSRCKKWGAQGGKSNVFFAKTLDERFIIKQVTKTELESFLKFAPGYFKYLSESISTRSPTCLAKIMGIYQVTTKHVKGGKESKMDLLVMENLLFGRNVTRLYDLKGSSRSRYNPDCNGSNKVLLDQNLIEAMLTSPIFVGNKAKRLLSRAVWNDTAFLASIDVMDYSLLVGVDEEKHELVLGIIDFMRQYTWDKHLETWVKASGILGGPKNSSPTVISPKQYKIRFRKAMQTYFLMVPDQWSPPSVVRTKSQTDFCEELSHVGTSVE